MTLRRRTLLLALPPLGLAACGFAPRREPELRFRSLGLQGFKPGSPLAAELRRQLLARTQVQVPEDFNRAELVLEARRDERDKRALVTSSAGQVREWELRLRVDYLLRTAAGEVLLPPTELRLSREMSYTEAQALAKEQEEAQLFRAMQSDAVTQILRRLATVRLPG